MRNNNTPRLCKIFALIAIFLASSALPSLTNPAEAALTCSGANSAGSCKLTHDRGFGNFFHTTHAWAAGPGGLVRPGFTITREWTIFICTCQNMMPVAFSVDYSLLLASS